MDESIKHKPIRVLIKYFYENCSSIKEFKADPKKASHLEEFYRRCTK